MRSSITLMQIHEGTNRRLIVTQPPRSLKSICTSVAFVAWSLGLDPSKRFACVSYSQELAATFARQFRAVVTSDWYRALFPHMRLAKDTETECVTTEGGGRFAVAVGGSFTGRGADVIIVDDPMKADDAQSEKARRAVNDWYGTTLLSRLDDKEKGAIILVMQRLHEDDLAGKLLRDGGWRHLDLPAIAEDDQDIPIGPGIVHHRKKGEVLHPERESLALLEEIKREMGSLAFSAQYLQRPVPLEGNLIKRDWIKWYDTAPNRGPGAQIVQSWDVASTTAETSDWSVCTTWLMMKRNYYLLDVWRGRLEFPHLKRKLIALAGEYAPRSILIEQAGPGLHLIQEFRANPTPAFPCPSASSLRATNSCGWKPKARALRPAKSICPRMHPGSAHCCMRSSPFRTRAMTTRSTAFRSSSTGPKAMSADDQESRCLALRLFTVEASSLYGLRDLGQGLGDTSTDRAARAILWTGTTGRPGIFRLTGSHSLTEIEESTLLNIAQKALLELFHTQAALC